MDEPTEGLAPVIVSQVADMLLQLGEEGDVEVLVIEQNIGVATADFGRSRDHGQRPHQPTHGIKSMLANDRELQQNLLGVGRHSDEDEISILTGGEVADSLADARCRSPQDLCF